MGSRGRKSATQLATVPASTAHEPVTVQKTEAPKHLSAEASAWWNIVVRDYSLEHHHLRLLQAACEAWDRMQEARKALEAHGLIFMDTKGDPKTRPEVAIERDSRVAFARLVRELDLDVEAPADRSRPPALLSNRR